MLYFTIICVGKNDFLPFEFSSDITTSIYWIYNWISTPIYHTSQGHYSVLLRLSVIYMSPLSDAT